MSVPNAGLIPLYFTYQDDCGEDTPHIHLTPSESYVWVQPHFYGHGTYDWAAHHLRMMAVGPPGRLDRLIGNTWAENVQDTIDYWTRWLIKECRLDVKDHSKEAAAIVNRYRL